MAIDGAFPVAFEDVFPHGAFASGEVTVVKDWDLSTAERTVQQEVQVVAASGGVGEAAGVAGHGS